MLADVKPCTLHHFNSAMMLAKCLGTKESEPSTPLRTVGHLLGHPLTLYNPRGIRAPELNCFDKTCPSWLPKNENLTVWRNRHSKVAIKLMQINLGSFTFVSREAEVLGMC